MTTQNWCPAGIMSMRRAYPVNEERVTKVRGRNAWRATCPLCDRPNVPVVKVEGVFYFSGHKESNAISVYSKERRREW